MNLVVEQYLRMFCNYDRNNWADMLPLAQFAYNNSAASATDHSSFGYNYGFHLKSNWSTEATTLNTAAELYSRYLNDYRKEYYQQLQESRESMLGYYNKGRQEGPIFKKGDLFMLDSGNMGILGQLRKLEAKYYGPFKIIERIRRKAYSLELPPRMKIHSIFNILLLELFKKSQISEKHQVAMELVEIDGGLECEVEKILGSILVGDRSVQYLVK